MMLPIAVFVSVAVGVIFILAAVPLMRRRIGPNRLYGLRVRATYADERVWYEANAATGRDLLILGVIQLLAALLPLPFIRQISEVAYVLVNVAVASVGAILLALVGLLRADGLLKKRRGGDKS
jgi:uncharacterized membrane protein